MKPLDRMFTKTNDFVCDFLNIFFSVIVQSVFFLSDNQLRQYFDESQIYYYEKKIVLLNIKNMEFF